VEDRLAEADAFFPALDPAQWQEKSRECHSQDEKHLYSYTFIDHYAQPDVPAGSRA
jgi:dihydrofolate reductase